MIVPKVLVLPLFCDGVNPTGPCLVHRWPATGRCGVPYAGVPCFVLWLSWSSPNGLWRGSTRRNTPCRNSSQVDKLNTLRYGPPQDSKRHAGISSITGKTLLANR